jgi:hypothetical protein
MLSEALPVGGVWARQRDVWQPGRRRPDGGEVELAATRWVAAGWADAGPGARRRREERAGGGEVSCSRAGAS